MARHVQVPVKKVGKEEWGDLSVFGHSHEFVGEVCKLKDDKYSFAGGHRVRLYLFKKNVHWRIAATEFDISDVPPAEAARKKQR